MIFEDFSLGRLLDDDKAGRDGDRISRANQVVSSLPGFFAVLRGSELIYTLANNAYCDLVGVSNVIGRPAAEILSPADRRNCLDLITRTYQLGEAVVGQYTRTFKSAGETGNVPDRLITFVCNPIVERGEISGVFFHGHDPAEADQLSMHDSLTGLITRDAFLLEIEKSIDELQNSAAHVLLYLDLDQFKIINEICGHRAGDEFLCRIASTIRTALLPSAAIARLGGDEFGVLLPNCPEPEAIAIANILLLSISDLEHVCRSRTFHGSASIGLVSITTDSFTAADALGAADAACFLAKDKGRNRIHVYRSETEETLRLRQQMDAVGYLRTALKEDLFELFGQQISPLDTRLEYPEHYEVLIRLWRPDGTLALPASFISAAERYGLMPAIDRYVITRAFAFSVGENCRRASPFLLSINLSGATLGDDSFLPFIYDQVLESGVDPNNIFFEITETTAIADGVEAASVIANLKSRGFRFALDDFGSGMSSFGYLRQLPVDCVKIDGAFVRNLENDEINADIIEAIVRITARMDIATVAEYVEDPETIEALRRLGVGFGQGYGIHKPEPLSDCLLRSRDQD
jgi:diguanylate cyclase (GGDEF)-like protein